MRVLPAAVCPAARRFTDFPFCWPITAICIVIRSYHDQAVRDRRVCDWLRVSGARERLKRGPPVGRANPTWRCLNGACWRPSLGEAVAVVFGIRAVAGTGAALGCEGGAVAG